MVDRVLSEVIPRGEDNGITLTQWAKAMLYNGLGKDQEAMAEAAPATQLPESNFVAKWAMVELIEAASRSGADELAAGSLERLSVMTSAAGTGCALGLEARSRALLSQGNVAEHWYRASLEHLDLPSIRVELARAHLVYGEWLRRENRRLDARDQLLIAHDTLAQMGIEAFAERAPRAARHRRNNP